MTFEKIFPADKLSKRERVERTLNHQPIDRVAILEQLSYNAGVISMYTGKNIDGFNYTLDDICEVIRRTTDFIMPPAAPRGTEKVTTEDGFVYQNDNWTAWHISRPFNDPPGAREWLKKNTLKLHRMEFDPDQARKKYHDDMLDLQKKIGQTVILNFSTTNFCHVYNEMGLEIYTFFCEDFPGDLTEYMEMSCTREVRRIHAVADKALSPVILVPEDFSTKQGPIFSPEFLHQFHYPYVKRLVDAWHEHDIKVLYHSDGNYKKAIPDLMACGVEGFYCLEPACGMDVIELKKTWPNMVWAGGLDGVDLMERGTPEKVRAEVHRHIRQSNVLQTGGMFMATSAEINPPVKPENYQAMIEASGELWNPDF
jgi:hypothetical protein